VDAQLFPGSSGSIVISKPRELTVVDGKLLIAPSKQFAFLGVYSGRPFPTAEPIDLGDFVVAPRPGFGAGIVWEAAAVEDMIRAGKACSPPADEKE
jgi:hypothetical protein